MSLLASEYVENEDEEGMLLTGKEKLSTRLSSLAGLFLETPWGEIKKLNNVRMSQARNRTCLVAESLHKRLIIRQIRPHYFDSNLSLNLRMLRPIHMRHPPATNEV